MPEIEIRPINSSDLEVLTAIDPGGETSSVWQMERLIEEEQVKVVFKHTRLPRSVRIEFPHTQNIILENNSPYTKTLTASLVGIPVGYICLKRNLAPNAVSIVTLVVKDEVRRQGIGSALIYAAQDWALTQNIRRMIIEMQSKNYPAISLARKLGFEFCGYNDHYYSNQDIALFFAKYLR